MEPFWVLFFVSHESRSWPLVNGAETHETVTRNPVCGTESHLGQISSANWWSGAPYACVYPSSPAPCPSVRKAEGDRLIALRLIRDEILSSRAAVTPDGQTTHPSCNGPDPIRRGVRLSQFAPPATSGWPSQASPRHVLRRGRHEPAEEAGGRPGPSRRGAALGTSFDPNSSDGTRCRDARCRPEAPRAAGLAATRADEDRPPVARGAQWPRWPEATGRASRSRWLTSPAARSYQGRQPDAGARDRARCR